MSYPEIPNSSNKKRFDMFLEFTGRDILTDAGSVSVITAKAYAETDFENLVLHKTGFIRAILISWLKRVRKSKGGL